MRAPLSVVLIVKNEEDRLPGALESVAFADEIVVADTGSTDGTAGIARRGGARVESIGWEGFVASRNRVLSEARHEWILVLDADERVSPAVLRAGFLDGVVGLYVAFFHASSYFLRAAFLLEIQRRHLVDQKGRRKEITT